ncbi:MAG: ATP synthase subunit C, partial [Promethearchaeota archaeon]
MDPTLIGVTAAALCIVLCAGAAGYSIKTCGPALASVTAEKPELGGKLSITIILGEALAIYGLLISFMIIARVPGLQTESEAWTLVLATFTMGGTAITASLGIAYCGPALM